SEVVVAIHPDDATLFSDAAGEFFNSVTAVTGGPTRQASTRLALKALADKAIDAVLIHDAVRPFVDAALIDRVTSNLSIGALPAVPVSDTLKQAGADLVVGATVARTNLYAAQTRQGFPFASIMAAHERAFLEHR